MSLETSRLNTAHADKELVSKVKEVFREALLGALSEARQLTLNMERRDELMDDLTKYFHPDGNASDLFEAFCDVNTSLDNDIQDLTDELAMAQRRSGVRYAAE